VFAPESGDYDFIVRSDNAFKLWVNDPNRPLIDASVKSGNDTEYRESIRLLGVPGVYGPPRVTIGDRRRPRRSRWSGNRQGGSRA